MKSDNQRRSSGENPTGHRTLIRTGVYPQIQVNVVTTGKFEVFTDKAGEYRFRLKAPNGEIIAASEGYSSKASCMNGIESVKKNAPTAVVIEVGN